MRVYIFFTFLFIGCSINGSLQGLLTYQKSVIKKEPQLFIHLKDCDKRSLLKNSTKVKIINGKTFKECISSGNNLIYIWKPNCTSKKCIPIEIIKNKSNLYDFNLYIIAEYYDLNKMKLDYHLKNGIFAIDNNYYNTKFVDQQLKMFFQELTEKSSFTNYNNSYYLFKDGNCIARCNELKDLNLSLKKYSD